MCVFIDGKRKKNAKIEKKKMNVCEITEVYTVVCFRCYACSYSFVDLFFKEKIKIKAGFL